MQTILIVDDEPRIAQIARDYLERAGYATVVAGDGASALDLAASRRPDLVVLDLGLPRLDGYAVARALRERSAVPIIMLTARVDEADRLRGFEVGADDYVTKPFSPRELVARVGSVLRRVAPDAAAQRLTCGDLVLEADTMRVTRAGTPVELTPTEFQLLLELARHPGRVHTRAQLLDVVRGDDVEAFDRAIDTHVKNIRRKLEVDTRHPRYVLTVYGIGYRFADR